MPKDKPKILLENFVYFDDNVPVSNKKILIENGIIKSILDDDLDEGSDVVVFDLEGNYLVPGFIDLQVNGGAETFFSSNITEGAIAQICSDHLKFGTTSMLPTLITSPLSVILKAIKVVKGYMEHRNNVLGLHIEGPFLNPDKKGAHNPKYLRTPTDYELETILEAGHGVIKMMTIAPELFSDKQIDMILGKGVVLSAGHSNMSSEQAKYYFSRGINCVTHLYNAMSQFNSREPGLVGATLNADVYAGIIVDGIHCSYTSVEIAQKLKREKLFLVSDSTFIGTRDLELDGIKFIFSGKGYVNDSGTIAGSNITMLDAVKHCVNDVGISLPDAIKMATEIPMEVFEHSEKRGKILPGFKADIAVLSKEDLSAVAAFSNENYLKFKG